MSSSSAENSPLLRQLYGTDHSDFRSRRSALKQKVVGIPLLLITFLLMCNMVVYVRNSTKEDTSFEALASCDPTVKSSSGYVELPNDDQYFYWFFESRRSPSDDPLVIWLTGGPGCSSMVAALSENGPCTVTEQISENAADIPKLTRNEYSWNNAANIIYVDQPTGVGFSYGSKMQNSEDQVGKNMVDFIHGWLEKFPEFAGRDFYITGESYGGHWVPNVAYAVMEEMKTTTSKDSFVNLRGVAIGNGLTNPVVQYQHVTDMAFKNNYGIPLVSAESYAKMLNATAPCLELVVKCQKDASVCEQAQSFCNAELLNPMLLESGKNPYDIRKDCLGEPGVGCYDNSKMTAFMNNAEIQRMLNVKVKTWQECDMKVNNDFSWDWMRRYDDRVASLLENKVRVLIYAGTADLMCNWIGNYAWVKDLGWSGRADFNTATPYPFVLQNQEEKGEVQSSKNGLLTYIRIDNAGHMVPMDQPEAALEMINKFFSNTEF